MCNLENLRHVRPDNPSIIKLAAFFNCSPETLCPPWLKMIEGIRTRVRIEKEVTQKALESSSAFRLEAPASDEERVNAEFEMEWLQKAAKALLSERDAKMVATYIGLDGELKIGGYAALGAHFGIPAATARYRMNRAMNALKNAWKQRETSAERAENL